MARQGGLHVTGSYRTGGRSSLCLSGVYNAEIGTTVRVASIREDGQTFQDNRMPAKCRTLPLAQPAKYITVILTNHPAPPRLRSPAFFRRLEWISEIQIQ